MAARGYEISLRALKKIFYEREKRTKETFFNKRGEISYQTISL